MSAGHTCAGCAAPTQSFDCVVAGVRVQLCAQCAGRLLAGEARRDVIKSVSASNAKSEAA
jgi:hypothetical protein